LNRSRLQGLPVRSYAVEEKNTGNKSTHYPYCSTIRA
jgi:hypothetical protein